jgi:hypothetical protein
MSYSKAEKELKRYVKEHPENEYMISPHRKK